MPTSSDTLLMRPFAEPDRAALGRVYARAFPDKLAAMLDGHMAAAPVILTALVDPANTWVAARHGELVGVACVQDEERPAPGHPLWRVLRRHLPPVAAARAWLHNRLIHTVSVGRDRLYLDYVAVDPGVQGQGIGGALLDLVIDEARRRGKAAVCLYVIDRNRAARRLYERRGFVALRSEHLRLFRRVAGFRWTEFMELRLDGGSEPGGARDMDASERGLRGLAAVTFDRLLWRRGAPGAPTQR